MTVAINSAHSLAEFLKLPETKPGSEYINEKIIQKPIPKGKHSRLQLKLCDRINENAENQKIAYAFSELRCTFDTRSIVLDIASNGHEFPLKLMGKLPMIFYSPQIGQ